MAQFVLPIRDDGLKTEIEECFAKKFKDADEESLTREERVIKHLSNYVRQLLNDCREENAKAAALEEVIKEDSLV